MRADRADPAPSCPGESSPYQRLQFTAEQIKTLTDLGLAPLTIERVESTCRMYRHARRDSMLATPPSASEQIKRLDAVQGGVDELINALSALHPLQRQNLAGRTDSALQCRLERDLQALLQALRSEAALASADVRRGPQGVKASALELLSMVAHLVASDGAQVTQTKGGKFEKIARVCLDAGGLEKANAQTATAALWKLQKSSSVKAPQKHVTHTASSTHELDKALHRMHGRS